MRIAQRNAQCAVRCGAEVPLLPSSELPRGSEDVQVTPPVPYYSPLALLSLSQSLFFLFLLLLFFVFAAVVVVDDVVVSFAVFLCCCLCVHVLNQNCCLLQSLMVAIVALGELLKK